MHANGDYGSWIRLVSARATGEVSFSEYKYENNTSPKLLDIIDVPLLDAAPHNHQTENHVIDAKTRWLKQGKLTWNDLEKLRDQPESLWINSDHTSVTPGSFDCMSAAEAATLNNSLLLIRQEHFTLEVGRNSFTGKRNYRGSFDYKGTHHNFSVTDPLARDKPEGDYPLNDVYLCISLTEPYENDGRCHKLVAAIIRNPPLGA